MIRKRVVYESVGTSLDDLIDNNAAKAESVAIDFSVSYVDKIIEGLKAQYAHVQNELATLEELEDE